MLIRVKKITLLVTQYVNKCLLYTLVLTAVVIVNEAIEMENAAKFTEKLNNAGLTSVEESLSNRYLSQLMLAKKDKAQAVKKVSF